MRDYIKGNNSVGLFFFHLLFPALELSLIVASTMFEPSKNILLWLAGIFGVAHIGILKKIYQRSFNSESLNYLLTLGENRLSLYIEIIGMYVRETLTYTLLFGVLMFFVNPKYALIYIGTRLLFSLISLPVFINNLLEVRAMTYIPLSVYYIVGIRNIWILIIIAIPTSVYLMHVFKKRILEGNLI